MAQLSAVEEAKLISWGEIECCERCAQVAARFGSHADLRMTHLIIHRPNPSAPMFWMIVPAERA